MGIGVYAGSFNPIHNVHLSIANKLINDGIVDKVIFVPAGDGYDKKGLALGKHRLNMIARAIDGNSNLEVSDIEIANNKLYSYQTLDYFKGKYFDSEICFIMGSDNLQTFHTWKRYKYILENYKLIVFLRNGQNKEEFDRYLNCKNIVFVEYNVSLSASEIREDIKKNKYDEVKRKVHDKVFDYIKEFNLYE